MSRWKRGLELKSKIQWIIDAIESGEPDASFEAWEASATKGYSMADRNSAAYKKPAAGNGSASDEIHGVPENPDAFPFALQPQLLPLGMIGGQHMGLGVGH